MTHHLIAASAAALALSTAPAQTQTLAQVLERGTLICGANIGQAGFGAPDSEGVWHGFDVGFCRALAAAVLGDPMAVDFLPLTSEDRFDALTSGAVDLLARNTTWTFQRDVDLNLTFVGISYFDGQGFLVNRDMGVSSALDLDGATICVASGTTTELNLSDYFRVQGMSYTPVPAQTAAEALESYLAGDCDVYSADISALASSRASFAEPDDHIILPETVSKEPLGPVVREADTHWASIVRWTLFALIAAEELGITAETIAEQSAGSSMPEIRRLLGVEGEFGAMLGLDPDWAARAITAVGNYGELFATTIGDQTQIGLARGLNAQWTRGGLIYAPPFR